jgi:septal ring factor EnvC (AmiA/AmiB activator)|tara:strand:+ start:770 stop:961 length:192 start_codon:yes stop_codon:yes gene_type:complete
MENKKIEWEDSSNASIKMHLQELQNEISSVKHNILKMVDKLENIEKEYYYGNKILTKRYKGVD